MSLLTAVLMCGFVLGGGASHVAIPARAAALATLADEAAPAAVRLAEEDVDDEGDNDNADEEKRAAFVTAGVGAAPRMLAQDETDDEDDIDDLDDEGDEELERA